MVKYADLMGSLEAIKISTNQLQEELDDKFAVFSKTIKYLESNLRELSKQSSTINQDNVNDTTKKLEHILKVEKQELNQPLIKYQKNILLEEKKLTKITQAIAKTNDNFKAASSKDPKAKPQLTAKDNSQLSAMILILNKTINDQKQMVERLLDNLKTIEEQATTLNDTIKPFYYFQEQDNLIKHIKEFNKKFPPVLFSAPEAKNELSEELSEQVTILQARISHLKIASSSVDKKEELTSCSTTEPLTLPNSPKHSPRATATI